MMSPMRLASRPLEPPSIPADLIQMHVDVIFSETSAPPETRIQVLQDLFQQNFMCYN